MSSEAARSPYISVNEPNGSKTERRGMRTGWVKPWNLLSIVQEFLVLSAIRNHVSG